MAEIAVLRAWARLAAAQAAVMRAWVAEILQRFHLTLAEAAAMRAGAGGRLIEIHAMRIWVGPAWRSWWSGEPRARARPSRRASRQAPEPVLMALSRIAILLPTLRELPSS